MHLFLVRMGKWMALPHYLLMLPENANIHSYSMRIESIHVILPFGRHIFPLAARVLGYLYFVHLALLT